MRENVSTVGGRMVVPSSDTGNKRGRNRFVEKVMSTSLDILRLGYFWGHRMEIPRKQLEIQAYDYKSPI